MKNKTHIMTDIETLGTKDGATIFQIAAASFDIETGKIKDTINLKLDISTVKDLQVDGSTLRWWLETNSDLLAKLISQGVMTEEDMMQDFHAWVLNQGDSQKNKTKNQPPVDVTLWGNGILFDNAKIKRSMESLGLDYPIFYRNDRDVRTILALAADKTGLTEWGIRESVVHEGDIQHDALSDVMYQIRLVCHCYSLLMDKDTKEEF